MDEQMKTGETGDKNAVIDQKLRQFFDGKIVRKDLTKKIKLEILRLSLRSFSSAFLTST